MKMQATYRPGIENEKQTASACRILKTGSQQVSRNKNARRGNSDPIQETTIGVLRCLMLGDGTKKERRTSEHVDPHIPWLYGFKLDFRFR